MEKNLMQPLSNSNIKSEIIFKIVELILNLDKSIIKLI